MSYVEPLAFFLGALFGSIPFGVVVTRAFGSADPRLTGSGNIGATNVLRTSGWKLGLFTLAGDIFKGAVAVLLVSALLPAQQVLLPPAALAGLGAVIGHMYSPFTGFRGGKGVATGLGVFVLLMPGPTGWAALAFAAVVALTRYVSLGSILAASTVPLAGLALGYPAKTTALSALIALLIIWRHEGNIRRLLRGEENRLGNKKKGAQEGA